MKLVKVTVRTSNGLIVECELTPQTIKELMIKYLVSVRELSGGRELMIKYLVSVRKLSGGKK